MEERPLARSLGYPPRRRNTRLAPPGRRSIIVGIILIATLAVLGLPPSRKHADGVSAKISRSKLSCSPLVSQGEEVVSERCWKFHNLMLKGGANKKSAEEKAPAKEKTTRKNSTPEKKKSAANSKGKAKESDKKKLKKMAKDPDKPKKPKSAFLLFLDKFREENKAKYDAKSLLQEAGKVWGTMSDADKAPYEKNAAKLKAEHESAMEAYKEKQSNSKAGQKPKKPMSAFFHFMTDFRKTNDGKYNVTEMVSQGGASWKTINESKKKKYEQKAEVAKKEYEEALKKWNELPDDE